MHIHIEPSEHHAILHLRGEFDTYYCPILQQEIDAIQQTGVVQIVLNLRMVKFINSTALGSMIKAHKALAAAGGRLLISHPSAFCRDIIEKVGLNRVVPVCNTDEEAIRQFASRDESTPASGDAFEVDSSSVLFSLEDKDRLEHFFEKVKADNPVHGHAFGKNWTGVGRMANLDKIGLAFSWAGGKTDLSAFDMGQLLALGTVLEVKFRLPLLQKGFCEALVEVAELEERAEGVKLTCTFTQIDEATEAAIEQYAQDMALLRDELGEAEQSAS